MGIVEDDLRARLADPWDLEGNAAAMAWKMKAEPAEAKVAAVEALHTRRSWDWMRDSAVFGQSEWPDRCEECRVDWPCNTTRVLASVGRTEPADWMGVRGDGITFPDPHDYGRTEPAPEHVCDGRCNIHCDKGAS